MKRIITIILASSLLLLNLSLAFSADFNGKVVSVAGPKNALMIKGKIYTIVEDKNSKELIYNNEYSGKSISVAGTARVGSRGKSNKMTVESFKIISD